MRAAAAAAADNKPPQLAQVVHAKMVALGWVRAATAAQARLPWWRDAPVPPPAALLLPPKFAAAAAASPSRQLPAAAVPCVACGGASAQVLHLAHVALPFWATCAEHA